LGAVVKSNRGWIFELLPDYLLINPIPSAAACDSGNLVSRDGLVCLLYHIKEDYQLHIGRVGAERLAGLSFFCEYS
jgi:hypothetical protein